MTSVPTAAVAPATTTMVGATAKGLVDCADHFIQGIYLLDSEMKIVALLFMA